MAARALFPGQHLPEALAIIQTPGVHLMAPGILRQEFLNSAWRLQRRGALSAERVDAAIARFEGLGIEFLDSPDWPFRALQTARRFNLPRIYDAIYLHCAEDIEAELWTCDRRFVAALSDRPAYLRLCPENLGD
jgi:predicted nucleic acid-binding protein